MNEFMMYLFDDPIKKTFCKVLSDELHKEHKSKSFNVLEVVFKKIITDNMQEIDKIDKLDNVFIFIFDKYKEQRIENFLKERSKEFSDVDTKELKEIADLQMRHLHSLVPMKIMLKVLYELRSDIVPQNYDFDLHKLTIGKYV